MYTLKKLNVERIVAGQEIADKMVKEGWALFSAPAATGDNTKNEEKPDAIPPENTGATPDVKPTEADTLTVIKDYAAAHKIDLKGAGTKAEILEIINGN